MKNLFKMNITRMTGFLLLLVLISGCHKNTNIPAEIKGLIKIKNWIAFGPFVYDTLHQNPRETIYNEDLKIYGIKESDVDEKSIQTLKSKLKYANISEVNGEIELFKYIEKPRRNKSNCYFFTTVTSEIEQKVVLAFDYSPTMVMWLNGKRIFEGYNKRNLFRRLDQFITVTLKKGNNTIFMKLNKAENMNTWRFIFYVTSPMYAREIYKANYVSDFVEDAYISDTLKVYTGPYSISDIKSLEITSADSQDFTNTKFPFSACSSNSFTASLSGLNDGFYNCRVRMGKDSVEEIIYKGDLHEMDKKLTNDIDLSKIDTLVKNELNANFIKFHNRLWNRGDGMGSSANLWENEKKTVYFAYNFYNVSHYLKRGNVTFKNLPGTYAKSYYSNQKNTYGHFLFHVSKKNMRNNARIPLVLIIPYGPYDSEFFSDGYYDQTIQNEADVMLADKYGFAIAWPGSNTNESVMEDEIKGILSKLKNDYCIDTTRIYLLGDCLGAPRALSLALNHPPRYKAMALFVPANLESWAQTNGEIYKLKGAHILIARAKEDIEPLEHTTNFIKIVEKIGLKPEFIEYNGWHEAFRKDHRKVGFEYFNRN